MLIQYEDNDYVLEEELILPKSAEPAVNSAVVYEIATFNGNVLEYNAFNRKLVENYRQIAIEQ